MVIDKMEKLEKTERESLIIVSQRWVVSALPIFCQKFASMVFLHRLMNDTLLFGKFQDTEAPRKMMVPQLNAGRLPIPYGKAWFYKARKQLLASNLMWANSNPYLKSNVLYTINFPGMSEYLLQLMASVDRTFISSAHYERFNTMFEKSVHVYRSVGISKSKWRLDMAPTDIAAITRQSNAATDTKMQTKKLSAQTVEQLMSGWCDEYDLNFIPPRTQKEYGQVGLWVRECTKRGETAKEIKDQLKSVVQRWAHLQGELVGQTGRPIPLSKSVSFDTFYKFRRQILDWLEFDNSQEGAEAYDSIVIENLT